MNYRVAGVCVTFNPDGISVLNNILKNASQFETLYIVDNSDSIKLQNLVKSKLNSMSNIKLIQLYDNKGIAYALNIGCQNAMKDGFGWALTLDQDSVIPDNMVNEYQKYIIKRSDLNLGIVTCAIKSCDNDISVRSSNMEDEIESCWTSGALTNLEALKQINGYKDELFIDGVDFALCADMILNGYKIIRLNWIILNHHLGESREVSFFNRHLFFITNHNPIRRYYMTRNGAYLSELYGDRFEFLKDSFFKRFKVLMKILLFENNKLKKIQMMRMGIKDYKKGILGKISL